MMKEIMMEEIPRSRYDAGTERMLKRYEEAGLSPVQCMSDVTSAKARYAQADGYADGVLVGGVSLILAGIICKWLSKKELERQVQGPEQPSSVRHEHPTADGLQGSRLGGRRSRGEQRLK